MTLEKACVLLDDASVRFCDTQRRLALAPAVADLAICRGRWEELRTSVMDWGRADDAVTRGRAVMIIFDEFEGPWAGCKGEVSVVWTLLASGFLFGMLELSGVTLGLTPGNIRFRRGDALGEESVEE